MRAPGLLLVTLALAGASDPARAGRQPISVSLLECGEIFAAMADQAERRGSKSPEQIDQARLAVERFRQAAVDEARQEGRDQIKRFLEGHLARLTPKWEGRFAEVTLFSENMDWVKYCAALGKDRGVLPVPR